MDSRQGIDFIGVTVPFVIHDGKGHFLLQKRSQKCRDERGSWDVGGGSMEFGEEWEGAVRREVEEELGVKPLEIRFLKAYNALRNNDGVHTHWIALVHAVLVNPGSVRINEKDKIDEIGWFTLDTLPKPLHSKMRKSLEAAAEIGLI